MSGDDPDPIDTPFASVYVVHINFTRFIARTVDALRPPAEPRKLCYVADELLVFPTLQLIRARLADVALASGSYLRSIHSGMKTDFVGLI